MRRLNAAQIVVSIVCIAVFGWGIWSVMARQRAYDTGSAFSSFRWETESMEMIYVHSTTGFSDDPACGILGGAATPKSFELLPQPIPSETEIAWSFESESANTNSAVRRTRIAIPEKPLGAREMLVFRFANENWTCEWRRDY